jgi:hypothetical protein
LRFGFPLDGRIAIAPIILADCPADPRELGLSGSTLQCALASMVFIVQPGFLRARIRIKTFTGILRHILLSHCRGEQYS